MASATKELPRLKQQYRESIIAALREEFQYENVMQVPGLVKIVVNMGVGEAARDAKLIEPTAYQFRRLFLLKAELGIFMYLPPCCNSLL